MFKDTKFPKHTLSSNNSLLYFVNLSTECFPLAFTAILHFNLKHEQNQNLNSIFPLATPSLMCITYMDCGGLNKNGLHRLINSKLVTMV